LAQTLPFDQREHGEGGQVNEVRFEADPNGLVVPWVEVVTPLATEVELSAMTFQLSRRWAFSTAPPQLGRGRR